MEALVKDIDNGIDPEAEVRKLQDLVKKLERQNQMLRSKQKQDPILSKSGIDESDVSLSKQNRTCTNDSDNIKDSLRIASIEDLDLIDINKLTSEDDDETWLFKNPHKPSSTEPLLSPYAWLRYEFEHPSPEAESARRSFLYKLDEFTKGRVSRSSSSGTLGSLASPTSGSSLLPGEALAPSVDASTAPSTASLSVPAGGRQPLLIPGLGTRVNTGTFTRPKKHNNEKLEHESDSDSYNTGINTRTFTRPKKLNNERRDPELIDDCNTTYVNSGTFTRPKKQTQRRQQPDLLDDLDNSVPAINTNTFTRPRKNVHTPDSEYDLDGDGVTYHDAQDTLQETPQDETVDINADISDEDHSKNQEPKFTDVTSLQEVAKMQEESLRQSYSSPLMSPRRSLKLTRSLRRPEGASVHGAWLSQEESHSTSHQYNTAARANSARFCVNPEEYKAKCLSKDSLASTASSHSNSNTSSPPSSPYGSQYLDQKPQVSDTHRRSLPNLARTLGGGGGSLQTYPSESRLSPRDSPPRSLSKVPARRPRNPGSGARQASPGRSASGPRTGIPTPRSSGIPRPGAGSKLPMPRKSGIPSTRKSNNASRVDESWKEGCY